MVDKIIYLFYLQGVYRSSSISSRHPDENTQIRESPRIERYQKPPNRTQNLPNGRHKHIRQYSHQRETQVLLHIRVGC